MHFYRLYQQYSHWPFGKFLFNCFVRWYVPYSGTIYPYIQELKEGSATVSMREKRIIRNHLRSIHAMALANLAELTSGLALLSTLAPDMRAILIGFDIQYLKKARGKLVAHSEFQAPKSKDKKEVLVQVSVKNEMGDLVCQAHAKWLIASKNG